MKNDLISTGFTTDLFLLRTTDGNEYFVKNSSKRFSPESEEYYFETTTGETVRIKNNVFANSLYLPIECKDGVDFLKNKTDSTDSVSILGTPYKIIREKFGNEDIDGETDYTSHQIRIRTDNVNKLGDFDVLTKKQLRHEIIHAFMAESGLQANFEHYRQFGHDETTVDWFAIQFPKMLEVFKQVGAL